MTVCHCEESLDEAIAERPQENNREASARKKRRAMNRASLIFFAVAACSAVSAFAAEAYPARPVRMIVPYAPGGNADIQSRYIAETLTDALGKQFVVDNRPGANGMIGGELAAHAPPDGYTIMLIANTFTVNPGLYAKVPFDISKDFQAVSLVGETPVLFVANPSVPANTVKELLALAKAKPSQLNYGSSGNGSPSHMAGALLETMTGVKLVHVPYKGIAGAMIDVVAGQIQLCFPSITSSLPLVKQGKLKAYAIATKARSQLAPDLPTMSEAGVPGYEASIWNGILVPAGTPRPLVMTLNRTIAKILSSPQAKVRYAHVGADIRYDSPEDFSALIKSDVAKWAKVIRQAGISVNRR
jgi:tripartite-type tricarboxylate transporter receptor subunit TctC